MIEILYFLPLASMWVVFFGAILFAVIGAFKNPLAITIMASVIFACANYDPFGLFVATAVYTFLHYQGFKNIENPDKVENGAMVWHTLMLIMSCAYLLVK